MLEDDDRQTAYNDYTATMQRHLVDLLGRYIYRDNWTEDMPSFIDMIHDQDQKASQPQQTNEEAKNHVYEIFGIKKPVRG